MKISELITKLQEKQEQVGDVLVECYNESGRHELASEVMMFDISRNNSGPFWRVFIC